MMEDAQRPHPHNCHGSGASTLGEAYFAFLGRGLVNLAHDFKNHLATINEFAGLMGDLLKLRQRKQSSWVRRLLKRNEPPSLNIDPFIKELNAIQEEVIQGSVLIQDIGNLAHRLAENPSLFTGSEALSLNELLKVLKE